MSLARAIETGDVALLPGRRDEDWRWSDLRGLIREIPSPAPNVRPAANPGLDSRFPKQIHFPDYTDDELITVFGQLAEADGFRLAPGTEETLRSMLRTAPRGPSFGNGRLMRNLLDVAVANQADRIASAAVGAGGDGAPVKPPAKKDLVTLTAEDLPPLLDHPEEFFGLYL